VRTHESSTEATSARKRRPSAPTSGYTKFAVTVPTEIAEAARKRVQSGRPGTMSALVSEALAEKLERDDLEALLAEMEAEFGPVPPETQEWADEVFDRIPER
jgi:ribosome assembly protein YihI (activator of Der GTPase)